LIKLGALDAMFLYNETATTPMHVAGLLYLEVPEAQTESFFDDLRAMLLERIHLVSYLTSRLEFTPMNIDHPVWVRHQEFDIDEHLFRVKLDAPGSVQQCEELAAHLYEPLMDRSKPLWEIWVIEGLANGQVALLQKTHHAAIDGMSSIKAAELLFDFEPQPRKVEPAPADFWKQTKPTNGRLLQAAYANLNRYWWESVQRIPEMMRASARLSRQLMGSWEQERIPTNAPKTRLNASIDAKRAFRNVRMSLPTLKAIAKQSGVKINDVMLAICGEGVARYLERHGEQLDRSLIASCPVSLHKAGDEKIGNQVSSINISMKNEVGDLVERLQAIHRSANVAKETMANLGDAIPTDFGGFGLPAAFQALARSMENGVFADMAPQIPTNLVLSNIPGFQVPMYVAGGRLVRQMPMSIVVHGSAINLTVLSYLDRMDLGITAASKRVPDIDALREDLQAAYERLVDTVLGSQDEEADQTDYEDFAVAAA